MCFMCPCYGGRFIDPSHVVSSETIELRPDLTYEKEPVEILARDVKELLNKKIPLVEVF